MKLLPIVYKILSESDIIKLPESEIRQITQSKLVPFIQRRIIPNMTDDIQIPYTNPYAPEEMNNIFTIPGYNNQEFQISATFYYDEKDDGSARMDVENRRILINMAKANIADLSTIIIHELTHAIDPKLLNPDVNQKIYQKHGPKNSERFNLEKNQEAQTEKAQKLFQRYLKDPREFDAHSGEVIRTLRDNFNNLPKENSVAPEYQKTIWSIVSHARTKTADELWNKYYYEPIRYFFTDNWQEQEENKNIIDGNFYRWLETFRIWATKPTLYKRFYNRLSKYVPYKA